MRYSRCAKGARLNMGIRRIGAFTPSPSRVPIAGLGLRFGTLRALERDHGAVLAAAEAVRQGQIVTVKGDWRLSSLRRCSK
jgi:hypothetical protein